MSNKLRGMKRKMSQAKLQQVPVVMVPIFKPVMEQVALACKQMDKERLAAWEEDDKDGRIRAESKGKEHVELAKPAKVDPISLVNSTMAQAAGEFLKGVRTEAPAKKEPGLIQVVGGEVARQLKKEEHRVGKDTETT